MKNLQRVLFLWTFFGVLSWTGLSAQTEFSVKFTFNSVVSGSSGREDPTSLPIVEGLVFSPFRAVPNGALWGMAENSGTAGQFSFSGWPLASSATPDQLDLNQYYEVTLTPEPGRKLGPLSLSFKAGRTSTGPVHYAVRSSLDGFEANLPASYDGSKPGDILVRLDQSFEMMALSDAYTGHHVVVEGESASPLVLRFYAWDAVKVSGTFKLDDVLIEGVLVEDPDYRPIPEILGRGDSLRLSGEPFDLFHFEVGGSYGTTALELRVPRLYLDAAMDIINPHDSVTLWVDQVVWNLKDSAGLEAVSDMEWFSHYEREVLPHSDGLLRLRLLPRPLSRPAGDTAWYSLEGSVAYTYGDSSGVFRLPPTPLPVVACASVHNRLFVPLNPTADWWWQQESRGGYYQPSVLSLDTAYFAVDTLVGDTLSGKVARWYALTPKLWKGGNDPMAHTPQVEDGKHPMADSLQAWVEYRKVQPYCPDSAYWPLPEVYALLREVSQPSAAPGPHLLACRPEALKEDGRYRPEALFRQDGRREEVALADAMRAEGRLTYRDTVQVFAVEGTAEGWTHADAALAALSDDLTVKSVQRLSDEAYLPDGNAWIDRRRFQLLDSCRESGSERYQVVFALAEGVTLLPLTTELRDSICLGDTYQNYGFDLPEQTQPGDFLWADTLVAWDGRDSLVCLYLNVCDRPSMPDEIQGDSLLVKAGNYVYTIRPVPQAAFYVWMVFPDSWNLRPEGNRVVLSVPFVEKGRLSVKAVNRCGESESRDLILETEGETSLVHLYPNPSDGAFNLEIDGAASTVRVVVYDLQGTAVYSQTRDLPDGKNQWPILLEDCPAGLYKVHVVMENRSSVLSWLKK